MGRIQLGGFGICICQNRFRPFQRATARFDEVSAPSCIEKRIDVREACKRIPDEITGN